MTKADTSIDAYIAHRDSGELGSQQKRIMYFYHLEGGEFTRSELAQKLGMRLSSVCARCHELIGMGYLSEAPRRPCGVTGVGAHPVKLPSRKMEIAA